MKYISPSYDQLININTIREHYLTTIHNNASPINPVRIKLIDTLAAFAEFIQQKFDVNSIVDTEKKSTDLLVSAYLFSLESITNTYKLFNPLFTQGRIFNSGSILYSILIAHLKINLTNPLTDLDKLDYLLKLYSFFQEYHKNLKYHFLKKNLNIDEIETGMVKILHKLFAKLTKETDELLKSIPIEKQIDNHMKKLLDNYITKKKYYINNERIFLAELGKCIVELLPTEEIDQCFLHYMTRSMRIKVGCLLYIMEFIKNTYSIRSPDKNSVLYDLCAQALNIKKPTDIEKQTRLECLIIFENFISDPQLLMRLETKLHKPVESLMKKIHDDLYLMITPLKQSTPTPILSNATISTAILGAIIMSGPGYGLGYTLGSGIAQTNYVFQSKILLNNMTEYVTKQILNNTGNFLTHFTANMIIDTTLERTCAKLFETFTMLVGAASGGILGIVIFDISYQTIQSLCALYKLIYPMVTPQLASDTNDKLVKCLLAMPPELFSNINKNKLKEIIGDKFIVEKYTHQPIKNVALI